MSVEDFNLFLIQEEFEFLKSCDRCFAFLITEFRHSVSILDPPMVASDRPSSQSVSTTSTIAS
ncbi:hypothetical protein H1Q63_26735 [Desmonostoc muscorum CCALA 125]|nr:hypothetical protein [Desmonostoc muscorum CCALA 125]